MGRSLLCLDGIQVFDLSDVLQLHHPLDLHTRSAAITIDTSIRASLQHFVCGFGKLIGNGHGHASDALV